MISETDGREERGQEIAEHEPRREKLIRLSSLDGDGRGERRPISDLPSPTADERVALDHIRDYFSIDFDTERDRRLFQYGADRCQFLANTLSCELKHLDRHQVSRYPVVYLQGDMGEAAMIQQWEGVSEARNTNDPNKLHDNHPLIDVEVRSEDNQTDFSGDSKVSLRDAPNDYYLRKLEAFDKKVRDGKIPPEQAHLFVPEDQVLRLKEAIDRRFEHLVKDDPDKVAEHRDTAELWKSRVHESPLMGDQYRFVIQHTRESEGSQWIATEKLRLLRDDLEQAAVYLDRCRASR